MKNLERLTKEGEPVKESKDLLEMTAKSQEHSKMDKKLLTAQSKSSSQTKTGTGTVGGVGSRRVHIKLDYDSDSDSVVQQASPKNDGGNFSRSKEPSKESQVNPPDDDDDDSFFD